MMKANKCVCILCEQSLKTSRLCVVLYKKYKWSLGTGTILRINIHCEPMYTPSRALFLSYCVCGCCRCYVVARMYVLLLLLPFFVLSLLTHIIPCVHYVYPNTSRVSLFLIIFGVYVQMLIRYICYLMLYCGLMHAGFLLYGTHACVCLCVRVCVCVCSYNIIYYV